MSKCKVLILGNFIQLHQLYNQKSKKMRLIQNSGYFKFSLIVFIRREKSDIPLVVIACCNEVERRGMNILLFKMFELFMLLQLSSEIFL